jgi:hypothetical protein
MVYYSIPIELMEECIFFEESPLPKGQHSSISQLTMATLYMDERNFGSCTII